MYFRITGKYYSSSSIELPLGDVSGDNREYVRKLRAARELPGLSGEGSAFIILVRSPFIVPFILLPEGM